MNKKGFTLIEVLLASAIAVPMLILIMQIVPTMLKTGKQIERSTQNTFLAISKLEEIKKQIASTDSEYGYDHDYNQTATPFAAPNQSYKFIIEDDLGAQQKVLRASVWNDEDNDNIIDNREFSFALDTRTPSEVRK